ncbi:protein BIC2-like [Rhodamnia argentea]|uniref:Protein BIC2-like n=1 Tax=Rhodamnia argentea TaxID=178133 RepID=A0ABM3HJM3_9MYRT|nr:protein BIC2-like [Rhodamnia argentea]
MLSLPPALHDCCGPDKKMKNADFSFATREDSKETKTQIGDENDPRRHDPACARPASKTAASAGEPREESPPPSPRLPEHRQPQPPFEHNAHIGEAKDGLARPQPDNACSGRERLKRHRGEVAGRVPIPDLWGQEIFLKDWMDYSAFDAFLAPKGVASAREVLMAEGRRRQATSNQRLKIEGRC